MFFRKIIEELKALFDESLVWQGKTSEANTS